jgi:heat shock protein HslJ
MKTNIQKAVMKITLLLISAIFSFAGDVPAGDNVPFSRIQGIDWNLAEVKKEAETVVIDREKAQREIYSIRFQEGIARGRGANNIYSAPYTAGENNTLSIRKIAGTYMLPLFEMENFTEYEYFRCLERTYRWEFHDWKLKLYTYDENKEEAILVFIPIYKS